MEATRRDAVEYLPLWAGQGLGMIRDVPSAADVMATLVRDTQGALRRLAETVRLA